MPWKSVKLSTWDVYNKNISRIFHTWDSRVSTPEISLQMRIQRNHMFSFLWILLFSLKFWDTRKAIPGKLLRISSINIFNVYCFYRHRKWQPFRNAISHIILVYLIQHQNRTKQKELPKVSPQIIAYNIRPKKSWQESKIHQMAS